MELFKVAEFNFMLINGFELGLNYYEGKQCEASYWSYDSFPVIAGLNGDEVKTRGRKGITRERKSKTKRR